MAKNLISILEEDGIELNKSGERMTATCPFHKGDREPSFTVYPEGTYWCFGCRTWGDPIKWLVDYRKMTIAEAHEFMGADYTPRIRSRVIKIKHIGRTFPFLYNVASQYHQYLLGHRGAMSYLESRGLTMDTILRYKIGYTDGGVLNIQNSLEYDLALETGAYTIAENGHAFERLTHRITFPNIVDENKADYIMGRTVLKDKMRYLGTSGHKPLQGVWDVRTSPVWILVEGHFDWALLRQWGYPSIALGGSHTTRDNIRLLRNKKVIMIPDCDEEGGKAAALLKEKVPDLELFDMSLLGVKDIGELGQQEGGAQIFEMFFREKYEWLNTNMSPNDLMTYFPIFQDSTASLSI